MNGWEAFVRLFLDLHGTNKTDAKVSLLEEYFRTAKPEDGVWALWFMTGNRFPRTVKSRDLRKIASEQSGLPDWMIEECYEAVGDLAETLALVLESSKEPELTFPDLATVVESLLRPLGQSRLTTHIPHLIRAWRSLDQPGRLLLNKLLLGGFRMGAAKTLVTRALARSLGRSVPEITQLLMGKWEPQPEFWNVLRGITPAGNGNDLQDQSGLSVVQTITSTLNPYPFYLAHPYEDPIETLGDPQRWLAEWKWDGIRGQLVRRAGEVALWTRGEELATNRFPEICHAANQLPDGCVLDGEILIWLPGDSQPAPFSMLQTRINRESPSPEILRHCPAVFLAYDLLEFQGQDIRNEAIENRQSRLADIVEAIPGDEPSRTHIRYEPPVPHRTFEDLHRYRSLSRERGTEGLMLKELGSPYGMGRTRGSWWKWKVAPLTIDAVLMHAMAGHGKRASLFTDYTFGLWQGSELVPVARAYSGLTDKEIREVDKYIRTNTITKKGAFRSVVPQLVMELGFDSAHESPRHKSGVALRFPRIHRWRLDKPAAEADHLETLLAMVRKHQSGPGKTSPKSRPPEQSPRIVQGLLFGDGDLVD